MGRRRYRSERHLATRRNRTSSWQRLFGALFLVVTLHLGRGVAIGVPGAGGDPAPCGWGWPVDAPVVDPFRPPDHRYGPGNRGLEFGISGEPPVVAVAAGTIGFVGSVAGRTFVVVHHPRQLRSTVGPLAATTVASGQSVIAGQQLGVAAEGLHLTARIGDEYVDPAVLLQGGCVVFRLIS